MILGIDEAGRGPVIGPLVVAGVLLTKEQEKILVDAGVTDSKMLTEKKRESLFSLIKKTATAYSLKKVTNQQIDTALFSGVSLNTVEMRQMIAVTKKITKDNEVQTVVVDCPSINPVAFHNVMSAKIGQEYELLAEHKADLHHTSVAAASILAKVTRDREIKKLHKECGVDFGSGYPSDPKTKEFLAKYWKDYSVFRTSWKTYKAVSDVSKQKSLGEY